MIVDLLGGMKQPSSSLSPKLMLQDVHEEHVMHMPHDLSDPNPTNSTDFIMMAARAYSTNDTWYIEYEVIGPPEQKGNHAGRYWYH